VANGKINKSTYVICNGFKRDQYIENISRLINGIKIQYLLLIILKNWICFRLKLKKIQNRIRIASEEEPKFEF
jgi:arginine decarboxylase